MTDYAFADRRIVIVSGGAAIADKDKMLEIIGRNSFRRPMDQAIPMLGSIMDTYEMAPDRRRVHWGPGQSCRM